MTQRDVLGIEHRDHTVDAATAGRRDPGLCSVAGASITAPGSPSIFRSLWPLTTTCFGIGAGGDQYGIAVVRCVDRALNGLKLALSSDEENIVMAEVIAIVVIAEAKATAVAPEKLIGVEAGSPDIVGGHFIRREQRPGQVKRYRETATFVQCS